MRRILLLLLASAFAVAAVGFPAHAGKPIYYAFGDSIAAGYGLSDRSRAYPGLLAESLGFSLTNCAADGAASEDFLQTVRSLSAAAKKELASAVLITVSIGGNDLIGQKNWNDFVMEEVLSAGLSGSTAMSERMKALYATLEENLVAAFSALRAISPSATILLQTLYNPYLVGIGSLFGFSLDFYVQALNRSLASVASRLPYVQLVDVASQMNGQAAYFYGGDGSFNLDFHPTAAGHEKIAEILYLSCASLLRTQTEPAETTVETTTVETSVETTTIETTTVETTTAEATTIEATAETTTVEATTEATTAETTTAEATTIETTAETTTAEATTIETTTETTTVEATTGATTAEATTIETTTETTSAEANPAHGKRTQRIALFAVASVIFVLIFVLLRRKKEAS